MEASTTDRILDAAEGLFAENGFSTSLRAITSSAGVNLAAVNYHFGSKEALIEQLFARRLAPLNRERLRLLDRLESAAPNAGPEIDEIVEAFLGPALRMGHDPQGATFMRLVGRTLNQRDDRILRLFTDQFREVLERFSAALGRELPSLAPPEVLWRLLFAVGAMAHTMSLADKIPDLSGGQLEHAGVETLIRRLVPFIVGGMRAPAPVLSPAGDRS